MSTEAGLRLSFPNPTSPFPFPSPKPWPVPFPPVPYPGPLPGPGPYRDVAATDLAAELGPILSQGPEYLKRLYCRPDYREVIIRYAQVVLRKLDGDPEGLKALMEFLKSQGVTLESQERFIPILIAAAVGASFVGGCVIGYAAEEGKARRAK